MIEVALMLEGQNGLNWPRWQRIARAVEDLGFVGLYRSDHFVNGDPPDLDSLELWVSLAWLAGNTSRIEFAPLVSPVSFRHPTQTVRMAAAVDDLSGGRLSLGLGAGWNEREHEMFGWDLLPVPERFARFEEGLEVITRLLNGDRPVSFEGRYYRLHDAILLPRPQRTGGPPVLIGGNGAQRTLPLAAHYADEWNGTSLTPERFANLSHRLDELLAAEGRQPQDVRRSMMTFTLFGRDDADMRRKMADNPWVRGDPAELRQQGKIAGTPDEIVEQLGRLSEAGVQRVMLQWLDLDDIAGLEALAASVFPQVK